MIPGTSCQATIGVAPPGRAGRHFATASSESLLRIVPEGRCDRSLARSAWKNATQKSRPVGYGMIGYEGRPGQLSRALNTYQYLYCAASEGAITRVGCSGTLGFEWRRP